MSDSSTLRFAVNLLPDHSVVTKEGEYLGTWSVDETDAFFLFTPEGHSEHIFLDPYRFSLCERIEQWLASRGNMEGEPK